MKDGCISWRYHIGFSKIHDIERLPKKHRHIEDWSINPNGVTGHSGSHPFLVDDFVRAVVDDKLPPNNAWDAANEIEKERICYIKETMEELKQSNVVVDSQLLEWIRTFR